MKGTIMIFLQMKSYPLIALIPVPVKGTIQSTEALVSAFTILIPVPVKGTINIFLYFPSISIYFNPVPVKGTIWRFKKSQFFQAF